MREISVPVARRAVSASLFGEGDTAVVLGHGAGGNRRTAALVRLAESLAATGRQVVLYNFLYTEERRRAPDPPARLEEAVAALGEHVRGTLRASRVVHGGKSMGGRIASQAVAK